MTETAPPIFPVGYYVLIRLRKKQERTAGGIILTQDTRDQADTRANTGWVEWLGPLAYKDKARFPEGAWCQKGDFVSWKRYQDQRFDIGGETYVVVADDKVDAVIPDPAVIR